MSDKAVVYFSVYETTKAVAEEIARQAGADLIEIVRELCPDSEVLDGLPVEMRTAESGPTEAVAKWLSVQ